MKRLQGQAPQGEKGGQASTVGSLIPRCPGMSSCLGGALNGCSWEAVAPSGFGTKLMDHAVVGGDILEQKVDAIVNAWHPNITRPWRLGRRGAIKRMLVYSHSGS